MIKEMNTFIESFHPLPHFKGKLPMDAIHLIAIFKHAVITISIK